VFANPNRSLVTVGVIPLFPESSTTCSVSNISATNVDNFYQPARLRHMQSPKHIRKADPESGLSFPPPFQQQAKYLSLADQFLAHSNGRGPGQKIQLIHSRKRFRRVKKKAA
jgi:hypothetical protein